MNPSLEYIVKKWNLDLTKSSPIPIRISRFKTFINLLNELGYKKIVEIGINKGHYSRILLQGVKDIRFVGVDPWLAYSDYVENSREQDKMDAMCHTAHRRLVPMGATLIRATSMEAVKNVDDESLDMVFIDGNHSFRWVTEDIHEWSKKVRKGGMIAGHDYWNNVNERPWTPVKNMDERIRLCQVKDVVDAWTKSHQINPWFIITGDPCQSWFWIKE